MCILKLILNGKLRLLETDFQNKCYKTDKSYQDLSNDGSFALRNGVLHVLINIEQSHTILRFHRKPQISKPVFQFQPVSIACNHRFQIEAKTRFTSNRSHNMCYCLAIYRTLYDSISVHLSMLSSVQWIAAREVSKTSTFSNFCRFFQNTQCIHSWCFRVICYTSEKRAVACNSLYVGLLAYLMFIGVVMHPIVAIATLIAHRMQVRLVHFK